VPAGKPAGRFFGDIFASECAIELLFKLILKRDNTEQGAFSAGIADFGRRARHGFGTRRFPLAALAGGVGLTIAGSVRSWGRPCAESAVSVVVMTALNHRR
jgi:hypothetical protein